MRGSWNSRPDRREFLLSAGVFAAAGAIADVSLALAPRQDQNNSSPGQDVDDQSVTTAPSSIDPDSIAHAERLVGIRFTDAERSMMSTSIGEQLAFMASRQKHPYPPNTLAPALRFDPRLPGQAVELAQRPIERSAADSGPPGDDDDIAFAPLTSLSRWLQARQITSARLTEVYLDRLKRFDPGLKCVITLTEELARRQARRADEELAAGRYRGPLHGIPWGAKDLFDTAGIRTTWGAEPFVDRVPERDATLVRLLEEAGAVLVAKLSLGALAYNDIWFGGRTNNPWNPEQGSSGSSAGSAAATAAGLVGFSIGTETLGSIVSPCRRCGAAGLRPTFGRVSRVGAMALCWSLDKIGPICRSVEDCALVLSVINRHDSDDPSSLSMPFNFDATAPVKGLRLGFNPDWFEGERVSALDREALDVAARIGVELVEIELPDWPYDTLLTVLLCEAAASFEELTRSNLDDTLAWQEPQAWPNTFRQSWFIPGVELVQADRFRRQCMQMMAEKFAGVDAILAPSYAASLLLITNATGHPSLTIRCGFQKAKSDDANSPDVPHGITLMGRLFDEGTLCRIGMAMERELGVWNIRPPAFVG